MTISSITAPAPGAKLAVDLIGDVNYTISKVAFGAAGSSELVSDGNPLPVSDTAVADAVQALADAIGSGSGGGTVGGATETTLAAILAKLIASPSTAAKQDAIKASVDALAPLLDGLEGALSGTLAVSASALPLPNGAATQATLASLLAKTISAPATEAKQDTANTALQNSAPADDLFAITPSDTVALATVPKALLVTASGNVAVRGTGANPVTLAVTAGQILPIRARYVYAANTTATVVGLV